MKQTLTVTILLALLLASCGDSQSQLKEYAQGYLNAMGNYKPTEARPYSTPETCEKTISFFEMMMEHTDPAVYADNMPAEITLGEVTISDDTCAHVAYHKSTPIKQQDGSIYMVKRDGQWLVHEVINVPPLLTGKMQPRTISKEELAEIKKNGPKKNDSKEIEPQE